MSRKNDGSGKMSDEVDDLVEIELKEQTRLLDGDMSDNKRQSTDSQGWFGQLMGHNGSRTRKKGFVMLDEQEMDVDGVRRRWCPEEKASIFSKLFFLYVEGLVALGYQKHLEQDDLWDVRKRDEAAGVAQRFNENLKQTQTPQNPQGVVWKTMWKTHGRLFMAMGLLKFVHDIAQFLQPYILRRLLQHIQDGGSRLEGFIIALLLFTAAMSQTLMVNRYFHTLFNISMHLKIGLVNMVFQKSLKITPSVKADKGVGGIVNLQSNDAAKLWGLPSYLHILWSGPLQVLMTMGLLVTIIGWIPAMAALLVMLSLIPINIITGKYVAIARKQLLKETDARVKLISEVISGIKAIKLYAWEQPYVERIKGLRERELLQIHRTQFLGVINSICFLSGPIFVALAAFATYTALGKELSADVAFPALALFDQLRFPIIMLPMQVMNIIAAQVAFKRLQGFMDSSELQERTLQKPVSQGNDAISISGGKFSWGTPKNSTDADTDTDKAKLKKGKKKGVQDTELKSIDSGSTSNGNGAHENYRDSEGAFLKDLNLTVKSGELLMVVGEVGCGKSSVLNATLGEMDRLEGRVDVRGRVAYTSQDPWIQNASLKANVLMGDVDQYDSNRYESVLDVCALRPDIAILSAGDDTEIGEKGVNLSGGQRHRVALARAVYSNADIYLLDDPLSAVDAHVGRQLFDNCIIEYLSDKTRVLVTHQVQYLPQADRIAVISRGQIQHIGSYQQLVDAGVNFELLQLKQQDEDEDEEDDIDLDEEPDNSDDEEDDDEADNGTLNGKHTEQLTNGESSQDGLLQSDSKRSNQSNTEIQGHSKRSTDSKRTSKDKRRSTDHGKKGGASNSYTYGKRQTEKGKLVKTEERAVGSVDKRVYKEYLQAWGPGYWFPLMLICAALLERGLQVTQNFWLAFWTEASDDKKGVENDDNRVDSWRYMSIYFVFGLSSVLFQFFRASLNILGTINASRFLMFQLLGTVVRLPMSFFDSQPTGRLLNRFTQDTESLDLKLSSSISSALTCVVSVSFSLLVVLIVTPGVLVMVVPMAVLYIYVQQRYIRTSRELKRLEALALSPIFGHFNETLQGLEAVRAFQRQHQFSQKNEYLLNESNRVFWPSVTMNRWLSIRLEFMSNSIVFGVAFFVAVIWTLNAGLAGLALTSALNMTGLMNWMIRQVSELEVNMNSVERMVEYNQYEQEKDAIIVDNRPPQDWPQEGQIVVKNLYVKYRPELDPVLKGLSFEVQAHEKIGVCGRTGCGKSTLMMSLYRIVEPWSGNIYIDHIETTSIGLQDLRKRLSLVPQDPVVFSGTVRSNLDPFQEIEDDQQIWKVLEQVGLASSMKDMEQGLDQQIQEAGTNLSTGQRQLLCMARALLRRSRILILDEATSNVDNTNDKLIQMAIRSAFKDCSVLTIAHRLHTIIDSDRILVLDSGMIKEFDTPKNLLANKQSSFSKLVEETMRGANQGLKTSASQKLLADVLNKKDDLL